MQLSSGVPRKGPALGTEPIPLLQLPFIVPELIAEIETLRVAVYKLVESRRKLLDELENCKTLDELKIVIKEIYLESARQETVDALRHRHRSTMDIDESLRLSQTEFK